MKTIILQFLFLCPLFVHSQNDSIAYSRDYEFTEGIFLNAEQFKRNDPVPKSAIVSSYPKSQVDFMKQVTGQKFITYKAPDGTERKVESSEIWGYCQNRSVFINFNRDFNRINQLGLLCHFTAIVSTPITYRDPMETYGINTADELRQYIYNTATGLAFDFNIPNMEKVLKSDPELYAEFMKLKKRKKADSIFIYLRKYNEKHPFYLPPK